jgi:hypothetical protein
VRGKEKVFWLYTNREDRERLQDFQSIKSDAKPI